MLFIFAKETNINEAETRDADAIICLFRFLVRFLPSIALPLLKPCKNFLRFIATIKGGIEFDKSLQTFRITMNYFRFCLRFIKQQIDENETF